MKKIINTIIYCCFLLYAEDAYSQCTINTLTTDWRLYDANDPQKPNNFNWTIPGLSYPVYLQDNLDNPSRNIELPYFCTQPSGSTSCGNQNTLGYELLGNTAALQDINPEDGWELVVKNFGSANLTHADNTGRGVANPLFVLYNRFTGRMKIYLALVGVRSGSSAVLRVAFKNGEKYTALFSHAEPMTKTFDNFDNTNFFKSINHIAQKNFSDDYYWLVSEIQTAYDPCACQRPINGTKPSIIEITPSIITSSDIDATIEGTTEQQLIHNGVVNGETDKKTSFKELSDKAMSGYNTFKGYKDNANTILNEYNQLYKNKLINKWWAENIKNDPSLAGAPQTFIDNAFNDFKSSDEGFQKMMGVSKIDKYSNAFTAIKGVASYLPYVGAAIGVIDFFSNGGKQTSTEPAPPMIFNSSFKVTGTITMEQDIPGFAFHNPGTILPGSPTGSHLTPFYNNVLGVINVVKAPSFEHFKMESVVYLDNQTTNPIHQYPQNDRNDALAAPLKQYHITNEVKYAINSASKLEVEAIDACIVLEYNGSNQLFNSDPSFFSTSSAVPFHSLINFTDAEKTIDERLASLEDAGMNLEYVSANYPSGGTASTIRFRTQYVPLKCLPNVNFVLFGVNPPKVYIKLLIKMKHISNSSEVTQVITYDVSDKFVASVEQTTTKTYDAHLWANTIFNQNLISQYTDVRYNFLKHNGLPIDNIYYSSHNVTYDPGTMAGNINATGDITIPDNTVVPAGIVFRAYGKIIVGQNVIFGDNVELRSGVFIDIPPTNVFNPTLTIILQADIALSTFNCSSSDVASLAATQSEIDAICSSTNYLQNSGQNKTDPFLVEPQTQKSSVTECSFYPNPVSSMLYVSLNLDAATEYSIEVTDITGRQLYAGNKSGKSGKNVEGVDVSELPAGIYFINVKAQYYSKTDKFVIVR